MPRPRAKNRPRLTVLRSRLCLLATFVIGFVVSLALLSLVYVQDEIGAGGWSRLATKLAAIYAPHLGVIIGGIAAARKRFTAIEPHTTWFYVSLLLFLLWNGLVVWRCSTFLVKGETVSEMVEYLGDTQDKFSFIVAGVMTYYFAKE
jgi:hypothetical protein